LVVCWSPTQKQKPQTLHMSVWLHLHPLFSFSKLLMRRASFRW
jgi:hypothetical protein